MNTLECTNERELTDAELAGISGGLHSHYRLYIEGDEDLSVATRIGVVATLPATPVTTPIPVG